MKVNGKDYPIYILENNTCLKPPTSQCRIQELLQISFRFQPSDEALGKGLRTYFFDLNFSRFSLYNHQEATRR